MIGVNLWGSFSIHVSVQLRQWLYPENTTSSRRGKTNLSTTNGMYLRALQRKACLLPEVSPFLFQTTTCLMWSSLCTGCILAGKAAKAVNCLQTAEEALVFSSNVGDAVLEQWSDKTFYNAAVRTTRVRTDTWTNCMCVDSKCILLGKTFPHGI